MGASGSGGFQQAQAAAAAGLHAMGGMRSGSTPPLDPSVLSATQVNLAGFGLGGLGNGEACCCWAWMLGGVLGAWGGGLSATRCRPLPA